MIWDGIVFLALISLCLAGWNVGLINSWRGPIAMVIATVVTQMFYIDFTTWICQQTMMGHVFCTFLGYTMMWLVVDIVTEIIMALVLTMGRKERPALFDRIGGVILALVRWAIICTFPMMAMNTPNKIPEPPKTTDGLINAMDVGLDTSHVLTAFGNFGNTLMPSLGSVVTSNKVPSFKPNYSLKKVNAE